jgi:hypothetical protein
MANPEDSSLWGNLKCHPKCFLLYSFNEILKKNLPVNQLFRAVTEFHSKDVVLK